MKAEVHTIVSFVKDAELVIAHSLRIGLRAWKGESS